MQPAQRGAAWFIVKENARGTATICTITTLSSEDRSRGGTNVGKTNSDSTARGLMARFVLRIAQTENRSTHNTLLQGNHDADSRRRRSLRFSGPAHHGTGRCWL